MEHFVYNESGKCDQEKVNMLISKAKSDSGCYGSELRNVHYQIGKLMGEVLSEKLDVSDSVMIPLLTGAVPFAMGVGSSFDSKICFYDPHTDAAMPEVSEKNVILVDEVINSGKRILEIADHYASNHHVILVTTVMPESSEAFSSPYDIYTFRVSSHRYTGAMTKKCTGTKGPDTAARLYSLLK